MADLRNFSMTRNGSVTVSVPRFDITCDVVDSNTGAFIKTLNGTFPASLQSFTAAQVEEAFREMVFKLLMIKVDS